MIQYVKEKYGEANVAQIGTFGTLAARAAIRDVGRALGMPIPRVDAVVAMVPEELQHHAATRRSKQSADLKKAYDSDAEVRELLDLAMQDRGAGAQRRHARRGGGDRRSAADRVRAAAAACRARRKSSRNGRWATSRRPACLKMDFLGLRNLTILAKAVDLIEQTTGERVDPYKFPLDDQRDVRPALPRRDQGHLPARKRRHSRPAAADEARPLPRHHRHQRALSPRPAGRRHGRRLRPGEARPQAGRVSRTR